jgi:hypothetical protein
VPSPCSLAVFSGTWQENLVHTICHSRYCRYVGDRAQHTRRILVQLCKQTENPISSSLPAYRDTTCTEPCIEACIITYTSINFGMQDFGRKSNVCAHNNRSVPIEVLTSVSSAPWCVVRISLLYPSIELHGHCRCAWRVIKCVPLVTDFMGRVQLELISSEGMRLARTRAAHHVIAIICAIILRSVRCGIFTCVALS